MAKIVHLNSSGKRGSIPKLVADIARYQKKHEHYFITGHEVNNYLGLKTYKTSNLLIFYQNILISRLFDRDGFLHWESSREIINLIKKIKPDIIHIHNLHGYWSNIERLFNFFKLIDTKLVWTLHDFWSLTGRCCYPQYVFKNAKLGNESCNKWQSGCGNCPDLNTYPKTFLDNSSKNHFKKKTLIGEIEKNCTLVLPSLSMETILNASYLRSFKKKIIYNGVDVEKFSGSKKKSFQIKQIGFIANKWSPLKGKNDIFKLRKLLPSNIIINIFGVDDEIKKKIGYRKDVKLFKRSNNHLKILEFYKKNDIIISPSRYETFGMIPLESVASGTPVFAYKIPSFSELYKDFKMISLFEVGDIVSIAKEIINQRSNYSLEIKEDPLKIYKLSNKKMSIKYMDLYNLILRN